MICKKCKKTVPDGAFCIECGARQEGTEHPKKKRGNGQGSVYRRGPGWAACHTTYRNGKRIVAKKAGFKTKKAALEWLTTPNKPTPATVTFTEIYEEWKGTHYPSVTQKRRQILTAAYNSCSKLHNEYWKDIGLKEMQAAVDGLSDKYYPRKNLKALFAGMSEYAVIAGYAEKSVAEYVKLPPEPTPHKVPFTAAEAERIWAHYNGTGDVYAGATLMMIYTGMRLGELLKLDKENVHLEQGYMLGGIKTAESKAGEIIIIERIKPIVQRLIVDEELKPMSDTSFRKHFDTMLEELGIPAHTPHECRHSTATLLAEAGVQPAIIQAIMRHTRYSQSAEYTHIARKVKIDALNEI